MPAWLQLRRLVNVVILWKFGRGPQGLGDEAHCEFRSIFKFLRRAYRVNFWNSAKKRRVCWILRHRCKTLRNWGTKNLDCCWDENEFLGVHRVWQGRSVRRLSGSCPQALRARASQGPAALRGLAGWPRGGPGGSGSREARPDRSHAGGGHKDTNE